MTISFECSHCGKLLRCSEKSAGNYAKCPKCQAVVTVPHFSDARSQTGVDTETELPVMRDSAEESFQPEDDGLPDVVKAWPSLPQELRTKIVTAVRTAMSRKSASR